MKNLQIEWGQQLFLGYSKTEGSLEAKLPTVYDQYGQMEGEEGDAEDQRGRKADGRRCRCVKSL